MAAPFCVVGFKISDCHEEEGYHGRIPSYVFITLLVVYIPTPKSFTTIIYIYKTQLVLCLVGLFVLASLWGRLAAFDIYHRDLNIEETSYEYDDDEVIAFY